MQESLKVQYYGETFADKTFIAGEQVSMGAQLRNTSKSSQQVAVRLTGGTTAIQAAIAVSGEAGEHPGLPRVSMTVPAEGHLFLSFVLRAVPGAENACTNATAIIERPGPRGSFHEIGRIKVAENLCVTSSLVSTYVPPEDERIVVGTPFSSSLKVENTARVDQPFCVVPRVVADGSLWSVSTIRERLEITLFPPFSTLNPSEAEPWEKLVIPQRIEITVGIEVTVLPLGEPPKALSISFQARGFLDC